jgi:hypothetical protein
MCYVSTPRPRQANVRRLGSPGATRSRDLVDRDLGHPVGQVSGRRIEIRSQR